MLIVDAQVHIWSAGPPGNPSHRQVNSYSAEECIRGSDVIVVATAWPQFKAIPAVKGAYYVDWFAVMRGYSKQGLPIYDLGRVASSP